MYVCVCACVCVCVRVCVCVHVYVSKHLMSCFKRKEVVCFPRATLPGHDEKSRVVKEVTTEIFCICRLSEEEPMACCNTCGIWFHENCHLLFAVQIRFCGMCDSYFQKVTQSTRKKGMQRTVGCVCACDLIRNSYLHH